MRNHAYAFCVVIAACSHFAEAGRPLQGIMLSVDRREMDLSRALADVPHEIRELPVGDVVCKYGNDESAWVAERKTASDLSASMTSGRLVDQTARLHEAGYRRIFWLVEGDLHGHLVAYENLLGACVNMSLRKQSVLIRTSGVKETAAIVQQLLAKGRCPPGIPSGMAPPAPLTKRKRDADKGTIYLRQLQCMPAISERVAKKLTEHFSTLHLLQQALEDLDKFPKIQLDEKTCLGTTRLKMLRAQLCDLD